MCAMVEKSGIIDFFCSVVASVTSQPPNIESLLEILSFYDFVEQCVILKGPYKSTSLTPQTLSPRISLSFVKSRHPQRKRQVGNVARACQLVNSILF